ncbi:VOC family protein [Vibrio nigripulchritudo]|uniref:VOC family protein n=1 Tax=Vibrio nigripulchritudo TaxID=28173 RepID=UPI0009BA6485|nr:VOC family protein [Vibrio nigripulchritudo]
MRKVMLSLTVAMLAFGYTVCYGADRVESEKPKGDSVMNQNGEGMNSYISIFEIPATDISRAINFYQAILGINIEQMEMPGMEMGLFPYEDQAVIGVVLKEEGFQPSSGGVTVYLNGGDNLQVVLDKVEKNGGKIVIPKTAHADESGFFAIFLDSEGNRMGLHSPN